MVVGFAVIFVAVHLNVYASNFHKAIIDIFTCGASYIGGQWQTTKETIGKIDMLLHAKVFRIVDYYFLRKIK